jgi:hypothetical protein
MPATRLNYIIVYEGDSQIYGASTLDTALASPPPNGFDIEQKYVLFIGMEPDTDELVVRPVPREEVLSAELLEKKKKDVQNQT